MTWRDVKPGECADAFPPGHVRKPYWTAVSNWDIAVSDPDPAGFHGYGRFSRAGWEEAKRFCDELNAKDGDPPDD